MKVYLDNCAQPKRWPSRVTASEGPVVVPQSFQRLDPREVSFRVSPEVTVFVEGRHPLGHNPGHNFVTLYGG